MSTKFERAQFVFSLRSPYAWMAARWVLPQLPASIDPEWRAFYPRPSFRNFPPLLEQKTKYLVRDVLRLVEHYGGAKVQFPLYEDPDWAIPHVAFEAAAEQGQGPALALALFAARWERGENPAEEPVLRAAVEGVGLDAAPVLERAFDEGERRSLDARVQADFDEHDIFGVPTLILPKGSRFWGHDRIEWALREGKL